jgi:hypothetical protein
MIYIFRTKGSTNKFVEAFAKNSGKQFTVFDNKKTNGEEFYNFEWPTFQGEMADNIEFCFQGLLRGTDKLKPFMKKNKWYYFDQPYFFYTNYHNHKDFNDQWYRINVNDVQTNKISNNPKHLERYYSLLQKKPNSEPHKEIQINNWRTTGNHILVIPPSYHTAKWYDFDEEKWVQDMVKEIEKYTDRPIKVRYKYQGGVKFGVRVDITTPLENDLQDCWAIVSFHSMCASHAVRLGIPSFCSEHSPAAPVSLSLNELNNIENPIMPEREKWMATLLGSQFTLEEMKSGYTYRYLNDN